jgi:hypothetical protein
MSALISRWPSFLAWFLQPPERSQRQSGEWLSDYDPCGKHLECTGRRHGLTRAALPSASAPAKERPPAAGDGRPSRVGRLPTSAQQTVRAPAERPITSYQIADTTRMRLAARRILNGLGSITAIVDAPAPLHCCADYPWQRPQPGDALTMPDGTMMKDDLMGDWQCRYLRSAGANLNLSTRNLLNTIADQISTVNMHADGTVNPTDLIEHTQNLKISGHSMAKPRGLTSSLSDIQRITVLRLDDPSKFHGLITTHFVPNGLDP